MLKMLAESLTARNSMKKTHEKSEQAWGFFLFYQRNGSLCPACSCVSGSWIILLLGYVYMA